MQMLNDQAAMLARMPRVMPRRMASSRCIGDVGYMGGVTRSVGRKSACFLGVPREGLAVGPDRQPLFLEAWLGAYVVSIGRAISPVNVSSTTSTGGRRALAGLTKVSGPRFAGMPLLCRADPELQNLQDWRWVRAKQGLSGNAQENDRSCRRVASDVIRA